MSLPGFRTIVFRSYDLVFRLYEILICLNELVFRRNEILIRSNELVFRSYEILIRLNELVFRSNELVFCLYEILIFFLNVPYGPPYIFIISEFRYLFVCKTVNWKIFPHLLLEFAVIFRSLPYPV